MKQFFAKLSRPYRPQNAMKQMSLADHIRELRKRVILSLVAIFIGTIIGYIWFGYAPFGMKPLGEILRGPYCSLPEELRADFTQDGKCRLLATQPFEMFMIRLKLGAIAGVVISSPFWLGQLWAFIAPGMYKTERTFSRIFITVAALLFVLGATLAYVVLDLGLAFLLGIGQDFQIAALSGQEYFDLVRNFLIIFGVSFELPLLIVVLNMVGILRYKTVQNKRRIIWVFIFIFGALMSPGGEVVSMLALSLAVGLLIELSFQFCRINDKRRERKEKEALEESLGSDSFDYSPAPVTPAEPINAPTSPNRPSSSTGSAPAAQPITPRQSYSSSGFDDVL